MGFYGCSLFWRRKVPPCAPLLFPPDALTEDCCVCVSYSRRVRLLWPPSHSDHVAGCASQILLLARHWTFWVVVGVPLCGGAGREAQLLQVPKTVVLPSIICVYTINESRSMGMSLKSKRGARVYPLLPLVSAPWNCFPLERHLWHSQCSAITGVEECKKAEVKG